MLALVSGDRIPYDAPDSWDFQAPLPAVDWAHRAARGVVSNLQGRHTIKWGFDGVDEETRAELVTTLAEIIRLAQGETMSASPGLREALAALAHEQWAGWMIYLFCQCARNPDGTATLPAWAVERWTRQMSTPYAGLTEQEKESDRAEAARMLRLIGEFAVENITHIDNGDGTHARKFDFAGGSLA